MRKIAGRGYLPFRLTEPPGWLSGEAIYPWKTAVRLATNMMSSAALWGCKIKN
jgi:hypothetical protein